MKVKELEFLLIKDLQRLNDVAEMDVTNFLKYVEETKNHGAYVKSTSTGRNSSAVVSGGPADKAGLKDGDIITKVGNVEVGRAGSVSTLVGEYMPGDTVQFTILRGDKEQTINITLGSYK